MKLSEVEFKNRMINFKLLLKEHEENKTITVSQYNYYLHEINSNDTNDYKYGLYIGFLISLRGEL